MNGRGKGCIDDHAFTIEKSVNKTMEQEVAELKQLTQKAEANSTLKKEKPRDLQVKPSSQQLQLAPNPTRYMAGYKPVACLPPQAQYLSGCNAAIKVDQSHSTATGYALPMRAQGYKPAHPVMYSGNINSRARIVASLDQDIAMCEEHLAVLLRLKALKEQRHHVMQG